MGKLLRFWLPYFVIKGFFLINVKIAVNGVENMPKNEGFVIASNHEHSWDPVLISVALKQHIHFLNIYSNYTRTLSKKLWIYNLEKLIFKDSASGFFLRFTQQIPVSYTDKLMNKKAILNACNYLKKGELVGIFPEGELKLRKKKIFPGVAILAQRNNARILPLYIQTNASSDSFLTHNFTKVKINIGKPFKFSRSVNYTKKMVMKEIYKLKND